MAERHAIQNCAEGHGKHPDVTVSYTLSKFIEDGLIFRDRMNKGHYHLTDWGEVNFKVHQEIKPVSGRSLSEEEILEIYNNSEDWIEMMKKHIREMLSARKSSAS